MKISRKFAVFFKYIISVAKSDSYMKDLWQFNRDLLFEWLDHTSLGYVIIDYVNLEFIRRL